MKLSKKDKNNKILREFEKLSQAGVNILQIAGALAPEEFLEMSGFR